MEQSEQSLYKHLPQTKKKRARHGNPHALRQRKRSTETRHPHPVLPFFLNNPSVIYPLSIQITITLPLISHASALPALQTREISNHDKSFAATDLRFSTEYSCRACYTNSCSSATSKSVVLKVGAERWMGGWCIGVLYLRENEMWW